MSAYAVVDNSPT